MSEPAADWPGAATSVPFPDNRKPSGRAGVLRMTPHGEYRHFVIVTRRTILTAISAAAAAQAQRNRPPNWTPKLGVLMQYSDSNLEFVEAEGFTSAQLRLNPDELDDAAIAALKDKIARSGIYISSLAVDGNHIDPDPAKRDRQNTYTLKCLDLCGKLGIPNIGGQSGAIPNMGLQQQVDEIVRTGKFTPPPPAPQVEPPRGAPAGTPLPETPTKPAPPKLPGLGTPAPATA